MAPLEAALGRARAERWWQTGRKVGTIRRAAAFVEDVGFAMLFPKAGIELPSLWQAAGAGETLEWGPDAERVWGWKDRMPVLGLAWYGRFVRGRPSLLSPSLLADLYPRSGEPDDFTGADLGLEARRIAEMILVNGPVSTALLREALGVDGARGQARFTRALGELGTRLVVTHFGTEPGGTGWPSAVVELTARAFSVPGRGDRHEARLRAAHTYLGTMITARPHELGNAFHWRAGPARTALEELVAQGQAARDGSAYHLVGDRIVR